MPRCLIPKLFCVFTAAFCLISCYEKQEGCLDIRAKNYDFEADESCEDCCTFPNMFFEIKHNWGDTLLFTDSIYTNSLNQDIRILNAKFYLSNIRLISGGDAFTINESIDVLSQVGTSSEIVDDIFFVQNSRLNYSVGSFESAQDFDGLGFTFGINGNFISENDSDSFVEDEAFFDEDNFIHTNFSMDYILDTISMDTLNFTLKNIDTSRDLMTSGSIELPIGIDFTILMLVDYKNLLNNINFEIMSEENDKILANLSDFFHI